MDGGYGGGGGIRDSSKIQDPTPFGANPTGDAVFDASQYAFFGGDAMEEIEIGGLEDEEDYVAPVGLEEGEFQLDKGEEDTFGSLSDIDDLSNTFSKLNKVVNLPTSSGIARDWGPEITDFTPGADFSNWFDKHGYDAEPFDESQKWASQQYSSSGHFMEPKSLSRASSYPEQLQHPRQQTLHHQHSFEQIHNPKLPFATYPPPGGRLPQGPPNDQPGHPNIPYHQPMASTSHSTFSNPQHKLNALPHGSQYGGHLPQLPHGLPINSQLQNQLAAQSGLHSGNHSGLPNNLQPQHFSHPNGLMPTQMLPPLHSQQTRMKNPFQPSFGQLPRPHLQLLNPQLSQSSPMLNNFDMPGLPDLRDQRAMPQLRSQHGMHYPNQGFDSFSQKSERGWPRFRSKYMSPDEIENILRMQLTATHSSDPYVEDYYYQACLSRKSTGSKLRHHFCPTNLRDSSKPRTSNEQHAFLQVDALGRVSFSSIRRPRPLLEIDSPNSSGSDHAELKHSEKPLEQEPLLAARVTIEDGMCLLLDVYDIDRFLQFNHLHDGGAQLRERREVLLEGLASSLQLVDPLGKNGHPANLSPRDDLVFLRLVSLPKGWKLLLKYLQLLQAGELTRVVCMGILRNLRFLFGNVPTDAGASTTTIDLANTVSSCVRGMELKALAACLASVVCSSEHPPLRPVGSPAGDGASVILKSVLEKATELLTDSHAANSCSGPDRAFWQASFDAFFGLLTQYCFNKYDSVVQSFLTQAAPDMTDNASDIAKAISREMPVELLRLSLPHTNEQQRKLLLEFAQRSMPIMVLSGQSSSGSSNS